MTTEWGVIQAPSWDCQPPSAQPCEDTQHKSIPEQLCISTDKKAWKKGKVGIFISWVGKRRQMEKKKIQERSNKWFHTRLALSSAGRALWVSGTHFQGLSRNLKHTSNSAHQSRFWPQIPSQPREIHPPWVSTGCWTPAFDSTAITRSRNPKGPWFWLRAWQQVLQILLCQ